MLIGINLKFVFRVLNIIQLLRNAHYILKADRAPYRILLTFVFAMLYKQLLLVKVSFIMVLLISLLSCQMVLILNLQEASDIKDCEN